MSATHQENLQRLLREQIAAAQAYPPVDASIALEANQLSPLLPLCHSLTSDNMVSLAKAEHGHGWKLFSAAKLSTFTGVPLEEDRDEIVLGTADRVFLFCGQFRYPIEVSACGLLFAPEMETHPDCKSEATPFDTGGLVKFRTGPDPAEPVKEFIARHSLPVPDYRELLARRLEFLFDPLEEYCAPQGRRSRPDPIGLVPRPGKQSPIPPESEPREWTVEVRVQDEVPLQPPGLAALYVSRAAYENEAVERLRAALRPAVQVAEPRPEDPGDFEALQRKCLAWTTARRTLAV